MQVLPNFIISTLKNKAFEIYSLLLLHIFSTTPSLSFLMQCNFHAFPFYLHLNTYCLLIFNYPYIFCSHLFFLLCIYVYFFLSPSFLFLSWDFSPSSHSLLLLLFGFSWPDSISDYGSEGLKIRQILNFDHKYTSQQKKSIDSQIATFFFFHFFIFFLFTGFK